MDISSQHRPGSGAQRQLANLKLISRLLGHELHSQSNAKTITLSRESVHEIQTTLDLYIEDVSRDSSLSPSQAGSAPSVRAVSRG